MTLTDYTREVNLLADAYCERLNARPNKLFGARHFAYPESMMSYYFEAGKSPAVALAEIQEG